MSSPPIALRVYACSCYNARVAYRGPNSMVRKKLADREALAAHGIDPDSLASLRMAPAEIPPQHARVIAAAAKDGVQLVTAAERERGMSHNTASAYGRQLSRKVPVLKPVRAELDRAGLTAKALARKLARAVEKLEHEDLAERAFGLNAAKIVLKLRGDLVPQQQQAATSAPANLNVLVQVLGELKSRVVDVTPSGDGKAHFRSDDETGDS